MFINYEKIGEKLFKLTKNESLKDLFYNKKIKQNCTYIEKNQKKVLKKLRKKSKIKVGFYIYDETKWKCQSLYDLMENEEKFEPVILVTKTNVLDPQNPSFQTLENLEKVYKFFKDKNMKVEYAYKGGFIPFKNFDLDIIIYQHPWYVETSQGPVVCSKFALTCYVPYYFPTTTAPIDYHLRFHRYVQNYYVFDEITKKLYAEKMSNKAKNVKVVGQPFLDYFRLNKSEEKTYTIYAPHWSICKKSIAYGTFEWNGKFMLEYAKLHPERNWIFKPHPLLFMALINNKIMTQEEAENYYNEWAKIGLKYESGDYLELFNKSKLLITDCSSFLGEYFLTENPVIHLISEFATPYNETINQIIENYYKVKNVEELGILLNYLSKNDPLKSQRIQALEDLGLKNNYAAENILNDLKEILRG